MLCTIGVGMNGFTLLVAAIAMVAYAQWAARNPGVTAIRAWTALWLGGILLFIASVALAMAAGLGLVRWW